MEKLRKVVNEIAYTRNHTALHRSLVPFLTVASSLYGLALRIRHALHRFSFFQQHRLPVPVISVGNLSWGGNGKTPMVEYITQFLIHSGISPLILTRGYAGGDEVKMLQRHLQGGPAKIGVGANRAATAASFFNKYGCLNPSAIRTIFDQSFLYERAQVGMSIRLLLVNTKHHHRDSIDILLYKRDENCNSRNKKTAGIGRRKHPPKQKINHTKKSPVNLHIQPHPQTITPFSKLHVGFGYSHRHT